MASYCRFVSKFPTKTWQIRSRGAFKRNLSKFLLKSRKVHQSSLWMHKGVRGGRLCSWFFNDSKGRNLNLNWTYLRKSFCERLFQFLTIVDAILSPTKQIQNSYKWFFSHQNLRMTSERVCDIRLNNCHSISVLGSNFLKKDKIICNFAEVSCLLSMQMNYLFTTIII